MGRKVFVLHSPLAPVALAEALRRSIDEEHWTLFSLSGYQGDRPLLGEVGENTFRLQKRKFSRNDFAGQFYACFAPEPGGTRIEGYFDAPRWARYFMRIWLAWVVLVVWSGMAYVFARRQFERMLRLDDSGEQKVARASHKVAAASGWLEVFYRLPGRVFSDPVGAIVEKELRFLSRAPRFRLLFLLACALGQLLWLPQMMRFKGSDSSSSWLSNNYLTFTCLYAMLILAENLFLNTFGFDRAAAQNWFVLPTPLGLVLRAKNIVACFFLALCFFLMVMIGLFLPIPHSALKLAEAAGVCTVYIIFMLGVGNLGSVYQPKPVDPQQSWRSNSPGKVQALMLLLYPVMYIPILLAFAARWASGEEWPFFVVLAVDLVLACGFYYVATDSAVEMAAQRREEIISTLSSQSGPISIS